MNGPNHTHPELQAQIDEIKGAFPAGDADGHRRYHELIIENTEAKKRLRAAIIEKTIPGLLWAALVWIGIACLQSIKALLVVIAKGGS